MKLLFLVAFLFAVPASGLTDEELGKFELYTKCAPMGLVVDLSEDAKKINLKNERYNQPRRVKVALCSDLY